MLKAPIDRIDQGQAYGDAYKRAKTHFDTRENVQNILWDACDKLHAAEIEKYKKVIAARDKALARLKEFE